MSSEACSAAEIFPTFMTSMLLHSVQLLNMFIKVSTGLKFVTTFTTDKVPVSYTARLQMSWEVCSACEIFSTFVASMLLLSGMHWHMIVIIPFVIKCTGTLRTHEFAFSIVFGHVITQSCFCFIGDSTLLTFVCNIFVFISPVSTQSTWRLKRFLTVITIVPDTEVSGRNVQFDFAHIPELLPTDITELNVIYVFAFVLP